MRKKSSAAVGHAGLWGPFKSEVLISEAEEATGGCSSLGGWAGGWGGRGEPLIRPALGLCHEEKQG